MSKRSSAAWARSMARLGRQMAKAGTAAVDRAVKAAAKQAKAAARTAAKEAANTVGKAVGKTAANKAHAKTPARPTTTRRAVPPAIRPAARPATVSPRPAGGSAASGRWVTGVAVAGATSRRWRLYIPPGLPAGARAPLLVLLHGCGQDAAGFAAVTRMHRVADRGGCLVLFPEQDRLANAQRCWNWFDTGRGDRTGRAQAEADAVLAAIDQACTRRADRQRVVVAGLSAGAGLAALLALRHPQRLAGVAMHSGVPPGTADSTLGALSAMRGGRATAPLDLAAGTVLPPLLVIHGSLDGVVASRNAQAAVQAWAAADGAVPGPTRRVQRGQRLPLQLTDFRHGRRLVATLAEVAGLGHAWSGGAAGLKFSDPKGPDASRLIWAFAQRLFRRAVPAT